MSFFSVWKFLCVFITRNQDNNQWLKATGGTCWISAQMCNLKFIICKIEKIKQVEKLNVEKCLVYARYSTNVKYKWREQVWERALSQQPTKLLLWESWDSIRESVCEQWILEWWVTTPAGLLLFRWSLAAQLFTHAIFHMRLLCDFILGYQKISAVFQLFNNISPFTEEIPAWCHTQFTQLCYSMDAVPSTKGDFECEPIPLW